MSCVGMGWGVGDLRVFHHQNMSSLLFLLLLDFVGFSCLPNVLHAVILNVQHVNIPLIACCLSHLGNYSIECFVVFLNDSKIYNFCDYASFIQLLPLTAMILVLFVHFG